MENDDPCLELEFVSVIWKMEKIRGEISEIIEVSGVNNDLTFHQLQP